MTIHLTSRILIPTSADSTQSANIDLGLLKFIDSTSLAYHFCFVAANSIRVTL